MEKVFFPPLSPLFIILILFLPLLIGFFIINVINTAFIKLGFPPMLAFAILFLSLIGSVINIPIKKGYQEVRTEKIENFFFKNIYPRTVVEKTVIAVNLGGAVIPILVSVFLILESDVPIWKLIIAITIVTIICYKFAKPIPGLGISIPLFIPPLASAVVAILLSHTYAPVIAYVSGVLGVLIGADLLNLNKIENLGATMASIGGAGTFDGIFLTGIISVLLV
jgi:uncharacterized membrane protein